MTQQTGNEPGEPERAPRHAAQDGAQRHPLIDMSRDPTPGVADHAAPGSEDDEEETGE
ncbi:MAG TPA: hypothetical protein VH352_16830 [Pseudonocardiaceae bacterium]|nr:hypothetical protein [Pseudonocardiaceae bacterium]